MRHRRVTALLGVTAVLGLVPPSAQAESFADALVEAYLNSPELANQRANVKIASESAVQARAGGRVTVEGTASLQATTSTIDEFQMPSALNLNIIQPIYTGGQVANSTSAAERRITSQEALLEDLEQDILFNAAVSYLNVKRQEALLGTARNNVRVLDEQLEAASERFEVGEVTRTDVEQARSRLAASRSNLAATIGALANARDDFRRAVGRAPTTLDPAPPLPDVPKSEDEAVVIGFQNDPELLAARLEREASGFDVRSAIGALLPQLSLQGTVSQATTFDDGFGETRQGSVGLFLTIPFYSGGSNYSAVRQAQADVEADEANVTTELRNIRENVGEAWSDLEVAKAQIRAGRLEVSAAQLAFEGVQEEAKVGARTTLDVLDAEQEVLDARDNLINAQVDEQVSAYALLLSMGLMTVEHLGLDVGGTYDGNAYYDNVRDRTFGYDETDDTVWTLDWRP
ncbi:MAG: TolC family outer membrane protein [Pseudomonadota bacterium]